MTLLLASFASANVEITTETITLSVDYGLFNDEDQETIREVGEFTLTNSGAENTTVKLSIVELPTDYSADEIADVSLTPNETKTVQFAVNVPHDKDEGESNIGAIVVKDQNNVELTRKSLIQDTKSMLKIAEVKVEYTNPQGSSETDSFNDDEDYRLEDEVKPGTEMTITFEVENLFDNDYDLDYGEFEQVDITLDPDDSDLVGDDFEEDHDVGVIDADKKEKYETTFTIDEEADAGNFILDIKVEVEDGKGAKYEIQRELSLEVERDRDDVRVTRAELSSPTTCDTSFQLEVELRNLGTRDQDFTKLTIKSPLLGINQEVKDIALEEFGRGDDEWERTFSLALPTNVQPTSYPITLETRIRRDALVDVKEVTLEVQNCAVQQSEPEPEQEEEEEQPVQTQPIQEEEQVEEVQTQNESNTVYKTVEDPYTFEDMVLAGVIVAIVLITALIIIFFIVLIRK